MLPSADLFSKKVGDLGIANDMHIVVYDVYGMQSAARTWWMFKVFGHDKVSILSGGLPKWIKEGNTASSVLEDIFANINNGKEQIIDARSKGRFNGLEPEPREGMRSGHMPGSISLPFTELLNPEDKTYLTGLEIKEKIKEAGIDLNKPIITTCGSGVTACSLSLGLFLIGKEDVAVYDGSWSEWGALQNTPVI
jgi:thiosulfate/3-mercaptopyruvate sulfurtransferase